MTRLLLAISLLVACSGDDGEPVETGDTGEEVVGDGISPYVEAGTIDCRIVSDNDQGVMTFFIEATANDPQGAFTLKRFPNYVVVKSGDTEVINKGYVVCQDDGGCTGTWREQDEPAVPCAQADNFEFFLVVEDDEGNVSPEFPLSPAR